MRIVEFKNNNNKTRNNNNKNNLLLGALYLDLVIENQHSVSIAVIS